MAMPAAFTRSRISSGGRPKLVGPSPETSIALRRPSMPLLSISSMQKRSACGIEVSPYIWRPAASMRPANSAADAASATSVQPTATI